MVRHMIVDGIDLRMKQEGPETQATQHMGNTLHHVSVYWGRPGGCGGRQKTTLFWVWYRDQEVNKPLALLCRALEAVYELTTPRHAADMPHVRWWGYVNSESIYMYMLLVLLSSCPVYGCHVVLHEHVYLCYTTCSWSLFHNISAVVEYHEYLWLAHHSFERVCQYTMYTCLPTIIAPGVYSLQKWQLFISNKTEQSNEGGAAHS